MLLWFLLLKHTTAVIYTMTKDIAIASQIQEMTWQLSGWPGLFEKITEGDGLDASHLRIKDVPKSVAEEVEAED